MVFIWTTLFEDYTTSVYLPDTRSSVSTRQRMSMNLPAVINDESVRDETAQE